MSFFSFFAKKNEELSVLIDIGNGTISGSIVAFASSKKPNFLYTITVPFIVKDRPDIAKLIDEMFSLLDLLLSNISKYGFNNPYFKDHGRRISGVMIVFSSPWFTSKTKHVNFTKDSFFTITKSLVDNIIEQEEKVFKMEIQGETTPLESDVFEIIEKSIVHTKINGYTLENSIGKKTKNFDAFLYMSIISGGILNDVETLVHKHLHISKDKILIHTFPLISFGVIRDIFSASSDFLIIDITAEVTDITLVEEDVIKQSVSMPSGKNFIIRQIMQIFNVSSEIAESTLNLYLSQKLDKESVSKMNEILNNIEKEWSIYLENSLLELSPKMSLPVSVYMTADDDVAPIYVNFLKLSKTDSTAIFRKNISLTHVNKEATSGFYNSLPGVKVNEFLALLAIFYNKILRNS